MRTLNATAEPEEPAFGGVLVWSQPTTSAAGYPATVYFYGDRPTTIPLTQFGTTDAFAPGVVYFYPREQAT